jgi:hypothetical protein
MTSLINASTSAGVVISPDTSGVLALQTAGTTAVTIDASQNVGIGVTPAGTGGCLQLKSGITFPATQSASSDANTLDDYEEGTWTPSVGGDATYTSQIGQYTKVGNLVYAKFTVIIGTLGTGRTNDISGLPFSVSNTIAAEATGSIGYYASLSQSFTWVACYSAVSTTNVTIIGNNAASATIQQNATPVFQNNSRVDGMVVYQTA